MADQAPVLIVPATPLAVNLRMAMQSVALAPHPGAAPLWQRVPISCRLPDQTFATMIDADNRHPGAPVAEMVAYSAGAATPICPLCCGATFAGAVPGMAIPAGYAPDFAVPITFPALIAPTLRRLPHIAAACRWRLWPPRRPARRWNLCGTGTAHDPGPDRALDVHPGAGWRHLPDPPVLAGAGWQPPAAGTVAAAPAPCGGRDAGAGCAAGVLAAFNRPRGRVRRQSRFWRAC
jgi:hypothetical protein